MKTVEELKDEYKKKCEEIKRRDELIKTLPANLPGEIRSIHFFKGRPWVCYQVDTLTEAARIIEAYGSLADISGIESGCFSVQPVGEHGKEYEGKAPRWEVPQGVEIKQSGGKGFCSAGVNFYPESRYIRVKIEVEKFPYQFRAHMACAYNRYGDPVTCTFTDAKPLQANATARVKYADGTRDAFHISYFFSGVDHFREVIKQVEAEP
jgi:hypothetical protein